MRFVNGLIAITFAAGLLSAQPESIHVQGLIVRSDCFSRLNWRRRRGVPI